MVLVSQQPIEVIDLINQCFNFIFMACDELGGISPLQIFVLDLDVDNLRSVDFLKF